ncbi:hypothetical protein V1478_009379 [Vespula squamosa]|uniref:Uncharacterized protein n=1 Tax=Vespula squamosa TaxID=30214 RepID=A0ABD2APH0_VESSQ
MVAIEKEEEEEGQKGKERKWGEGEEKEEGNEGFVRTRLRPRSTGEEGKNHRPIFELNLLGLPVLPILKPN